MPDQPCPGLCPDNTGYGVCPTHSPKAFAAWVANPKLRAQQVEADRQERERRWREEHPEENDG